jgi:hypothetical protein
VLVSGRCAGPGVAPGSSVVCKPTARNAVSSLTYINPDSQGFYHYIRPVECMDSSVEQQIFGIAVPTVVSRLLLSLC